MSSQPSGSNTLMDERRVTALKGYREVCILSPIYALYTEFGQKMRQHEANSQALKNRTRGRACSLLHDADLVGCSAILLEGPREGVRQDRGRHQGHPIGGPDHRRSAQAIGRRAVHCQSIIRTALRCVIPTRPARLETQGGNPCQSRHDHTDDHADIATRGGPYGLQDES